LQHPVIGLVFSAVYNEIKAQKSKKKKKCQKKKRNVACSSFFFCFVMRERRQIGRKEAPEIGAMLQRKVGKLSSLSQAARWASLTGMHTFASETELHLICCYCLVFACCLMAAQMLE
jgi:hypothetical protein